MLESKAAKTFDGSNYAEYKHLKEALHSEIQELKVDAYQKLDLLRRRTTGRANDALQPIVVIQ